MGKYFHRLFVILFIAFVGVSILGSGEVYASGGSFDVPQINDQYGNYKKEIPSKKEKGFLDSITEPLSEAWDYVVDVASDFWNWFVGILAKITEVVVDALSAVLDWIVENYEAILCAIAVIGSIAAVVFGVIFSASAAVLLGILGIIGCVIGGIIGWLSGGTPEEIMLEIGIWGICALITGPLGSWAEGIASGSRFVAWLGTKFPRFAKWFPTLFAGGVVGGTDQAISDLLRTGKINLKRIIFGIFAGSLLAFGVGYLWNHFSDPIISAINKLNPFSKTQSVATKAVPKSCFTAGTLIQTGVGEKPIEKLKIGDQVLSKDEKTGKIGNKEVKHFFQREVDGIYEIYVNGEKIETTAEHPFWVDDKGWTRVKDLRIGDPLITSDGERLPIEKIIRKQGHTTVYNIEVEGYHTYFVSDLHIFVHNKAMYNGTGNSTIRIPPIVQSRINIAKGRTRFTPLRASGEPVSAGWDHVLQGHFNRPLANSRSIFTISPEHLKSILQRSDVVKSPVTAIPGGQYVRTVNVGEVVGKTALKHGGKETTWIQIYTDRAGNLITTYPVPAPSP